LYCIHTLQHVLISANRKNDAAARKASAREGIEAEQFEAWKGEAEMMGMHDDDVRNYELNSAIYYGGSIIV
jgi:hypothetical protein